MHSLTHIDYQAPTTKLSRRTIGQRFRLWRAARIEAKLERKSQYIARKLELNEAQRKQVVQLLRQFRLMPEIIREERRNGVANLYEAVACDVFDALRVSRGLESSVDRIHLHMDEALSLFRGLYDELDEGQRAMILRYLRRQVSSL